MEHWPVMLRPLSTKQTVWRAVWTSRLAILFCGMVGVFQIGNVPGATAAYDPTGLTAPFGYFAQRGCRARSPAGTRAGT